jgi:hypothetical protein
VSARSNEHSLPTIRSARSSKFPCQDPENAGYPDDLRKHAAVFTAYAKGQRLIARRHADAGGHDVAVEELLRLPEVDYIEVRDKEAGCYDFRIERAAGADGGAIVAKVFKC